jgi:hypothetical protein
MYFTLLGLEVSSEDAVQEPAERSRAAIHDVESAST